jgi:putative transposase
MKRKRFTEEQIVGILRQAEQGAKSIAEVCADHGITETSFYRWRRKYGALGVPEVRRLRELEAENARLKKLVAERDLELDALQELLSKNC